MSAFGDPPPDLERPGLGTPNPEPPHKEPAQDQPRTEPAQDQPRTEPAQDPPDTEPAHERPHAEPGPEAPQPGARDPRLHGTSPFFGEAGSVRRGSSEPGLHGDGARFTRPSDSGPQGDGTRPITVSVNGTQHKRTVEPRTLLSDFLRHTLKLTGTKVGCEQGTCGACTIHLDGEPVLACLTFAVQADNAEITTIEGLPLGRLQDSFHEHHALQCGFCTAGMLMTLDAFLRANPDPTEQEVTRALTGNLCRCTGYKPIVEAVLDR